uniref:Uncharacterized protein n=1 Tax=Romanomermis culicivorax TaxID=13658 RepID=A0A915KFD5_ROMCU
MHEYESTNLRLASGMAKRFFPVSFRRTPSLARKFLLEENWCQEEGPQKEKKKNMKKGNNGEE